MISSTTANNNGVFFQNTSGAMYDGTNTRTFGTYTADSRPQLTSAAWSAASGLMYGRTGRVFSPKASFDGSMNFTDISIGGSSGTQLWTNVSGIMIFSVALSAFDMARLN